MIDWVDAAMLAWTNANTLGIAKAVAHGYEENSLQALAYENDQNSGFVPGATIGRIDLEELENMPLYTAKRGGGIPNGKIGPVDQYGGQNFLRKQLIPVRASYGLCMWARERSDLTAMEHQVAFSTVYKALDIVIDGEKQGRNYVSKGTRTSYKRRFDEKSGKVTLWGAQRIIFVDCFWAESEIIPYIKEIKVNFKKLDSLLSGDPIDAEILQSMTIGSDKSVTRVSF